MKLRPYQQEAHDSVIKWVNESIEPCLIDAATGSGKSHIIAAIANTIHRVSQGKRILILQPSCELVTQNHSKFIATGNPASIYSASAGQKCLRNPVVFATPRSIIAKTGIESFASQFAMVIIDEAHGMTKTVKQIIEDIKLHSKNIRVVGLTATPYRMGTGYIYKNNMPESKVEQEAVEPFFHSLVFKIGGHELIKQGFLTRPIIGEINATGYDTSKLQLNSLGKFKQDGIDQAFLGQGRKTAMIVSDVVSKAYDRKGVMFFASTIQHAYEVLDSLPQALAAIVTGKTKMKERQEIFRKFKAQEIKYLVNVAVATTGFDAPHVDLIAILRATESVGLLQQIVGRGLRIADNKHDCLILDYAENIERHCPDDDIFNPSIKAYGSGSSSGIIEAACEECSFLNEFSARKNDEGFRVDANGYFMDLDGFRVQADNDVPMPAHYGRRCQHLYGEGVHATQCHYRWSSKECDACGSHNDIAARYCSDCKSELIDPNEKLIADFKAMKKDPHQVQCDKVIDVKSMESMSKSGREIIVLTFTTEYRVFRVYLQPQSTIPRARFEYKLWLDNKDRIETVTYKKQHDKNFYNVIAFNDEVDAY